MSNVDREPMSSGAAGAALVYTCPMHREVRQNGPVRWHKCKMALEPADAFSLSSSGAVRRMPWSLAACVFLAIAGFFLWQEHRAHLLGVVPYTLLLLCPLMHVFMHHGHGRGSEDSHQYGPRS